MTGVFLHGEEEDLDKYRPVCLTSITVKVMKQIILEAISSHMKDKAIGSSQHGFLKGRSFLANLIDFYNEIIGLVKLISSLQMMQNKE